MFDAGFPDVSKLNYLTNECGDQGHPLTHLLDYNGVRYHLFLQYNNEYPDCLGNKYLQKCYDAFEQQDFDRCEACVYDCMELFWPFIQKADADRERERKPGKDLSQAKDNIIAKIELKIVDGRLRAFEHHEHFKYPLTAPVENRFSSLNAFSKDEVEHVVEIDYEIHKVRIGETEYCKKTVYRRSESSFIREIETLSRIPCGGHLNVVKLIGVVDAGEGTIDGMVLGLILGNPLSEVVSPSSSQKEKWKRQISETISFLHGIGVVWGDVKPANILIDEKTDDAVLIDFGGGSTKGWVDHHLTETTQGDLQGLNRIIRYLDNLNIN